MSTTRGNNDPTKDADPNWPWRQPPRSRDEALDWAVEAICLWRKQAGVLWKPDRGGLEAILDDLETKRHGQGCEWLLRVGKVTSADVDAMLVELEEALGEQMAPALAYWVTEVLEGPLKARVTKEGRKLVALGMYLPMARLGLRRLFARAEPAQRVRPERLVP